MSIVKFRLGRCCIYNFFCHWEPFAQSHHHSRLHSPDCLHQPDRLQEVVPPHHLLVLVVRLHVVHLHESAVLQGTHPNQHECFQYPPSYRHVVLHVGNVHGHEGMQFHNPIGRVPPARKVWSAIDVSIPLSVLHVGARTTVSSCCFSM